MANTFKPVLTGLYGTVGSTWKDRMTAAALEQMSGFVSTPPVKTAQPSAKKTGEHVSISGVKLSVRNVMNQYGSVELEYKNKLEKELRAELQLRGQDPKILLKMDLSQMVGLKKELLNTPMPSGPKLDTKLTRK